MSKRWIAVALLTVFALVGIVGCRAVQDPEYQKAKAKVEASRGDYEAAVASLEVAETMADKEAALLKVTNAKATFDSDVLALEKIAEQPINTPATGFIGMIGSMIPGLPGWIATAAASAVAIGVNISRKRYGLALKEVAVGFETVTNGMAETERKAKRDGIAALLKGTGGDQALDKVLKDAGLLGRSKPPATT